MKKYLILILCFPILLIACEKEAPEIQSYHIFGFDNLEEARTRLGVYADVLFNPTNGSLFIRSTKFGANDSIEGAEIFARYQEELSDPRTDGGDFKFGDITLSFDEAIGSYLPEEGMLSNEEKVNRISSLFGRYNEFSLIDDGSIIFQSSQYVPLKIDVHIDNGISSQGNNLLSISRRDCQVSWNTDSNNENGVVVYLWWNGSGTDISPFEPTQGASMNKAIRLKDNGQAVLPEELFNDIPTNAIVTLFFIRGNVDIKEVNGKSFKFYSVTQDKYNLILLD